MKVPMELKTFAEDNFDAKQVINKAWNASGSQEKEVFVANAVSRLQLYMKQLTNSLDETTTQIVTSLPQVIQDATLLHEEGMQLQDRLLALELKVQGVEEQTGHSIESLQRIDKLKSKLESAASTLHEADKWAALTSSLENILEAGVPAGGEKLVELAKKVAAMTQSLEVLSDSPDYDAKRVQLETLYNRLEASISPPLIDALTQMDAERTARYVSLFSGMGRGSATSGCWRRAAAARLAALWRRLDAHSVPALARLLATHAHTQLEWLTNVLRSATPITELIRLYTDLLLSLDPSPTKIVNANLKLSPNAEDAVLQLIDLRRDIDEFVTAIQGIIDAPRLTQDVLPAAVERDFGRAAYTPLRDVLPKYTELATQLLLEHLKGNELKQDDLVECSRALLVAGGRCGGWLDAAYSRAYKIAGAAAYPYYLPALESFISAISSMISSHGRRIETQFLSTVSYGAATGVLSDAFAASLLLEAGVTAVIKSVADRHIVKNGEEDKEQPPLRDLPSLLLDTETKRRLPKLRVTPIQAMAALNRAKEHLATLSRNILKEPVETQLETIPTLPVWSNNDALITELPDFALSPQEYITEIGQYLMTLPQHLEMHIPEKQAPWQYLSEVCNHTCEVYAEKILAIRNMDELGTKRCLTDIAYLASVVEDLGSNITPTLKSLESSLRAAAPAHPAPSTSHFAE